jgi:hypothetical protein
MAASTVVFVDDAVRGTLPGVCAKTGRPASRFLTIHQDLTGGLGAAWVLVFFGPLGWLILALVAATRRRSNLTVRIPYADDELEAYVRAARRTMHVAVGTGVVLAAIIAAHFALVLGSSTTVGLLMATVVIGGIAVLVSGVVARRMLVGVGLDASGRWVTLSRVHPAFAAACRADRQQAGPAVPADPNVPFHPRR